VQGQFDAICSVEMLEAVGERYWDTFFAALDQHLVPGGRLSYSEAGFRAGYIDVSQLTLARI